MRIVRSIAVWSALVIGCFLLGGCCSIVNGRTQAITFKSQPEGANVEFDGKVLGKTPLTVDLERKPLWTLQDPKFIFSKEGHETVTIPIIKQGCVGCEMGNGVIWGLTGIIPGMIITMVIDGSTGAGIEYSLNQYIALLLPKDKIVSQSDTVKQYIVSNYNYIVPELDGKSGMYVDALAGLLNVPKNDQPEAIQTMKKLSSANKDVFKFADNVITQFGIQ